MPSGRSHIDLKYPLQRILRRNIRRRLLDWFGDGIRLRHVDRVAATHLNDYGAV